MLGAVVRIAMLLSAGAVLLADDTPMPYSVLRDWQYYNNAGWIALNSNNLDRAEKCFGLAIKTVAPYEVSDRRLMARNYCDLARVLYLQRRAADAQPLAEWSLTIRELNPKVKPAEIFQTAYLLGAIHRAQNHFGEAEACFRKALDVQVRKIGGEHAYLADTYDALGNVLRDQSKYKEAEVFYKKALSLLEKSEPDFNLNLADTAEHYAVLLRRTLRDDDAVVQENRARTIRSNLTSLSTKRAEAGTAEEFQGFRDPGARPETAAGPR